ncbi:flavin reductase family protein [bacterium]|nr:flavin reductase family protein [bacterium]
MNHTISTNEAEVNRFLFQITHGLYILTTVSEDKLNGQCIDALMQVTNAPPRVAFCVRKKSLTHEMILESKIGAISVIDKEAPGHIDTVKHFGFQSGRNVDKFADIAFELGENGSPILPEAKAFYECHVSNTIDLDTHTMFIADVDRAGFKESGEPFTYNEYRKTLKKKE